MSRPFPSSVWPPPWCVSTRNALCGAFWKKSSGFCVALVRSFVGNCPETLAPGAAPGAGTKEGLLHPTTLSPCLKCLYLARDGAGGVLYGAGAAVGLSLSFELRWDGDFVTLMGSGWNSSSATDLPRCMGSAAPGSPHSYGQPGRARRKVPL